MMNLKKSNKYWLRRRFNYKTEWKSKQVL